MGYLEVAKLVGDQEKANYLSHVMRDVFSERLRQHEMWGDQEHSYERWSTLLGEGFGEVCQATQKMSGLPTKPTDAQDLYTELIQLSALSIQIAEKVVQHDLEAKKKRPESSRLPFPELLNSRIPIKTKRQLNNLKNDLEDRKKVVERKVALPPDVNPLYMMIAMYNYIIDELGAIVLEK